MRNLMILVLMAAYAGSSFAVERAKSETARFTKLGTLNCTAATESTCLEYTCEAVASDQEIQISQDLVTYNFYDMAELTGKADMMETKDGNIAFMSDLFGRSGGLGYSAFVTGRYYPKTKKISFVSVIEGQPAKIYRGTCQ